MNLLDAARCEQALSKLRPPPVRGKVLRVSGLVVEAALPGTAVGTACEILFAGRKLGAEVVGFSGPNALLLPLGDVHGIHEGVPVVPRQSGADVPVGDGLLGRVVDAQLRPLDGLPPPLLLHRAALGAPPPPAMARRRISRQLVLGVRAIDGCLSVGEGQRLGIMAGPGVGKSVLLGMIARNAAVDVTVVGLIGERGREVREFIERDLGTGLSRAVVVVATGDESPLIRVRAALCATAVAEHFRAAGKRVLLLMDSLSRVAMAQREIGLAAGEPPTSRGYPPSVFAALPRLVERAGNDAGTGSITALYTLLAEGDDLADPVVDAGRAALDGHLVLSRRLASAGHFPAIDVLGSVSRVMTDIVTPEHRALAGDARDVLAAFRDAQDLIDVGAYVPGQNPRVDQAMRVMDGLQRFLRQEVDERSGDLTAVQQLAAALRRGGKSDG